MVFDRFEPDIQNTMCSFISFIQSLLSSWLPGTQKERNRKEKGNHKQKKYKERERTHTLLGALEMSLTFEIFIFSVLCVMFWHSFAAVTLREMIGGLV